MERFEIHPVLSSALSDVASFLGRWQDNENESSSAQQLFREDSLSIERRLRWLLIENPVVTDGAPHGYCIRDHSGLIRGLTLSFPAAFLVSEQRVLGLCSGSFFVEPQARTLGYYLFRKYLRSPGYSFFFATTCNDNSGPLWRNLGGCAVPNSETEHILPLRLDVMLPALVSVKTSSGVHRQWLGSLADVPIQFCSSSRGNRQNSPSNLLTTCRNSRSFFTATGSPTGSPVTDRLNSCNGDMGRARPIIHAPSICSATAEAQ